MAFELPKRRQDIRQIQIAKRQVPIEQIIAIQGQNPTAVGIETIGNLIGGALQQRAAFRRQGEELAKDRNDKMRQISQIASVLGEQPLTDETGLDPQTYISALNLKRLSNFSPSQAKSQLKGLSDTGQPVSYNPSRQTFELPDGTPYDGEIFPLTKKVLSGGVLQDIKNQESAISLLESGANAPESVMKRSTGLIGGTIRPKLAKIPLLGQPFRDPERAVFQQNVKTGLLKFLYSEAGKQLSDPERLAVTEAIGSVDAPSEEFQPKLLNAIEIMKRSNVNYLESLRESGYRVPGQPKPSTLSPLMSPKKKAIADKLGLNL